jgi:hypothetical protein
MAAHGWTVLEHCALQVFPTYLPWFCNYMVVKRAAQEANFHKLYIRLVDKLADKELSKALVRCCVVQSHNPACCSAPRPLHDAAGQPLEP